MGNVTTVVDWPHAAHQAAADHVGRLSDRFVEVHDFDPPVQCRPSDCPPVLAGVDHLGACVALLADFDDAGDGELDELVTAGPFCGCGTCEVREVLAAAWLPTVSALQVGTAAPLSAPDAFDGCVECVAREVVVAAWPVIADAHAAGFVLDPDLAV